MSRRGGCACGAIRYRVEGGLTDRANCHCRMCQRVSGAAVVAWATVRVEDLHLEAGAPRWWASSAKGERGACPVCGGQLFFRRQGGGPLIDLTVASLDAPAEGAPQAETWTVDRQPWVRLDPALPHHVDSGPDWTP